MATMGDVPDKAGDEMTIGAWHPSFLLSLTLQHWLVYKRLASHGRGRFTHRAEVATVTSQLVLNRGEGST
jgi:hypothetical protein